MKIEYKFITGESTSIEVYGEFEKIMLEIDNEFNDDDNKNYEDLSIYDQNVKNIASSFDLFEEVSKKFDKEKHHNITSKSRSNKVHKK